jgi:hypothetical protein
MPLIFYTEDEHTAAMAKVTKRAMALAQDLCTAKSFPCIRGPNDTPDGPGDYCDGCPAEENCPAPFKQWSK